MKIKETLKTALMAIAIFGMTAAFTACNEGEASDENTEETTDESSDENAEDEHDHEHEGEEHPSGGEHPE